MSLTRSIRGLSRLLALFGLLTTTVQSTTSPHDPQAAPSPSEKDINASLSVVRDLYWPEQHDCPLPCTDYANIHSRIPYLSVDRLDCCKEPVLLQFSVSTPLDDPRTTPLIRSCSLEATSSSQEAAEKLIRVENPKTAGYISEPMLLAASACRQNGTASNRPVHIQENGNVHGNGLEMVSILEGMKEFFRTPDNCDESFVFARSNSSVAGVYIGKELGKTTATSALHALSDYFRRNSLAERTVVQGCTAGFSAEHILTAVQKTALEWMQGRRSKIEGSKSPMNLYGPEEVWEITPPTSMGKARTTHSNSTLIASGTYLGRFHAVPNTLKTPSTPLTNGMHASSGLASSSDISTLEIMTWNSSLAGHRPFESVDTSKISGTMREQMDLTERQTFSTCRTHMIQNGDSCFALAEQYAVTVEHIESWNGFRTWGWQGCDDLVIGYLLFVGPGGPPMPAGPAPQQGTQCGPLVPGTTPPSDPSVSLAHLNPCPLKQ
ncbi:hypothetical protein BST61_g2696 [Cercospora zeina]